MIIDNNNDVYLWPFRVGISVLVTGGVGHQPHHDGLKVLPSGLVLIVQSLQGSILVSCQVTNLLLPHLSSPPLMGSDLVKKVKIPPWPDTETTQRHSPALIRAPLTKLPVTAALLTSDVS